MLFENFMPTFRESFSTVQLGHQFKIVIYRINKNQNVFQKIKSHLFSKKLYKDISNSYFPNFSTVHCKQTTIFFCLFNFTLLVFSTLKQVKILSVKCSFVSSAFQLTAETDKILFYFETISEVQLIFL